MNLTEYIQAQGGTATPSCPTLARVATDAGCSAGTLYLIALGHKQPSWRLVEKIEAATGKAVTRQHLRPDIYGPPAANDDSAAAA